MFLDRLGLLNWLIHQQDLQEDKESENCKFWSKTLAARINPQDVSQTATHIPPFEEVVPLYRLKT